MPAPTAPSHDHPAPSLSRRKLLILLSLFALAFIALTLLDRTITHTTFYPESRDVLWRQAIKHVGDLWTWLAIAALAFVLARDWRWPAALFGSAILGGGLAELGKLLIGRERPVNNFIIQNDAHYVWRPLFNGFADGSNLGLPSSHAATAFGGATMLAILLARNPSRAAAPLTTLAFLAAAACAISRVYTGAHFATDVLLGSLIGYLAAHALTRLSDTMSHNTPNPPPAPKA